MSFGTEGRFASKKAFAEHVKTVGADRVMVSDSSAFRSRGTVPVSELAGSSAVIVGPDVDTDRRWYANVRRNAKTGEIRIV